MSIHDHREVTNAALQRDLDELKQEVAELTNATKDLITLFVTTKTLIVFVKWACGIVTAVAAAWIIIGKIVFNK